MIISLATFSSSLNEPDEGRKKPYVQLTADKLSRGGRGIRSIITDFGLSPPLTCRDLNIVTMKGLVNPVRFVDKAMDYFIINRLTRIHRTQTKIMLT